MDPDIKAEFAALNERLDNFEEDRWKPTTKRVRELQEEFRAFRAEFVEFAQRVDADD
jgi:hypothetical protein